MVKPNAAIQRIALAATALVDREVAEMDPATITLILGGAIQLLAECRKNKGLTPDAAPGALHATANTDLTWTKGQARRLVVRSARDQGQKLKPKQSRELAEKLIQQGKVTTPAEIVAACR